ncbi:MAG: protein kinase domain-containing protein [Planctomycetota bacterium]|jgi:serine/threonine-protein kinase
MLAKLIIMEGPELGRNFVVGDGGAITFGRSGANQAVLQDRHLSRQHFQLTIQKGMVSLNDLQSSNGTWVNGTRVESCTLKQGDCIKAGHTTFAIEIIADSPDEDESPSGATVTLPEKARCLGPYQIECLIGQGGMGTVYRAIDRQQERTVALKVLQSERASRPESVKRFLNEARTGLKLDHDNIVRIYDVAESHRTYYIAMEYVDGPSVGDQLAQQGSLHWEHALYILRQMTEALEHAHDHKMVHRDIKPDNILMTRTGTAKLTDLGLARCLEQSGINRLTRSHVGLGTPHYMPPEQMRDAKNVDIRSDIYGLGTTFFHMLTGRPPYQAKRIHELVEAIRHKPIPSIFAMEISAPVWVDNLLKKMTAKSPDERYQNPSELKAAIDTYFSPDGRSVLETLG